jgi:hypothetical protein
VLAKCGGEVTGGNHKIAVNGMMFSGWNESVVKKCSKILLSA